jgi:hypothetical protein
MKRSEFDALLFVDVAERAAGEGAAPPSKPKYYGRPWSELRDEMVASGAKTVRELPARRIAVFYPKMVPANGGAKSIFRGLFGGISSG